MRCISSLRQQKGGDIENKIREIEVEKDEHQNCAQLARSELVADRQAAKDLTKNVR